ncbi:MAG TPA: putative Ig domain-containing protein, partial [Terriglobales bacterium]|nr:putative Ig domain-containing protein [Terriglobales bacterium]
MAKWIAKFSVTVALVSLMACGGGSGGGGNNGGNGDNNPPAISVAISPATSQTMVAGQAQNFTATVTHDSASKGVTWSVSGTGCTGSACGSFTNTTATAATYNAPSPVSSNLIVTVLATSAADTTKTASVAVTVVPEPSVTTTSLSDAVQSSAYTATLAATGGIAPLTWSISAGNLPAGLTLAGSTGVISGTPTTLGTSNFTVQVADASNPPVVATKALSITVGPAPLTITTTSLPSGAVNSSYSATLAATGGTPPISWSISSGTL